MKLRFANLSRNVRWLVAYAALVPIVVLVGVVTGDSWLGWVLTPASGLFCGVLAEVLAIHFDGQGEQE